MGFAYVATCQLGEGNTCNAIYIFGRKLKGMIEGESEDPSDVVERAVAAGGRQQEGVQNTTCLKSLWHRRH